MAEKCSSLGVPMGKDWLYTLHFADDQVILAEDEIDVDCMLESYMKNTKNGISKLTSQKSNI